MRTPFTIQKEKSTGKIKNQTSIAFLISFFLICFPLLGAFAGDELTPNLNPQSKEALYGYETVNYLEASPEKMKWWRDAKFGLFIHWGLYSVPGGLWSKDKTFETWREGKPENLYSPANYAEQILKDAQMPISEYKKLLPLFDWSKFNAQDFVNLCFASGQRYIVFTAKHCDGFANWNTKVSDWNICQTPYGEQAGRDPLKELADACHATKTNGSPWEVKLCIYYTQCINWNEPDAFPYDYTLVKQPTAEGFKNYLNRIVKPQLSELLTRYGSIGMIWFDAPRMITPQETQELKDLVNKLSPETIINGRLGHDIGNYVNTGDNGSVGTPVDFPWETGSSLTESYGYHMAAKEYKTSTDIILKLIEVTAHGGNYLLNIGPKGDGTIPDKDRQILTEVGKWTKPNGEAIFGTRHSPFVGDDAYQSEWGDFTQKGPNLYYLVTHWPKDGKIAVPLLQNKVKRISILTDPTRKPLAYEKSKDANGNDMILIRLPEAPPDPVATVIAIECEGDSIQLKPFKNAYDSVKKQIYLAPENFQSHAGTVKDFNPFYDPVSKAIVNWRDNKGYGATIAWTLEVPEAGEYDVTLDYSLLKIHAGIPLSLLVNGKKKMEIKTEETGGYDHYKHASIGTIRLEKGRQDFALKPGEGGARQLFLMQLKGVYLTKKEKLHAEPH
jgi:alpha-L-fucosidase